MPTAGTGVLKPSLQGLVDKNVMVSFWKANTILVSKHPC